MRVQTIIILILLLFALSSNAQTGSVQVKKEQIIIGNFEAKKLQSSGCFQYKT